MSTSTDHEQPGGTGGTGEAGELDRVSGRIAMLIEQWCAGVGPGGLFYMEELRQYVALQTDDHVAPGSPDRVLRELRRKGQLQYRCVNRAESLYEVLVNGAKGLRHDV